MNRQRDDEFRVRPRPPKTRHSGHTGRFISRVLSSGKGSTRRATRVKPYDALTDQAVLAQFEERGRGDRHQLRFIVAPEDAAELEELRLFARHLMGRMETDLGTRLQWGAVDHWDTDNPHTHVVLRGKDQGGRDLIIARSMRQRAGELATEWLGPRSDREIRESLRREVLQERWTELDRALQQHPTDGIVVLSATAGKASPFRIALLGRLQHLTALGLATPIGSHQWALRPDLEPVLRAMGERGDIVRILQRAFGEVQRELVVTIGSAQARPVIGRVMGKGLVDELHDGGYLAIDGLDGRAHYVRLAAHNDLGGFPIGSVVEARPNRALRAVDQTIAALASGGIYRVDHHAVVARSEAPAGTELGT